MGHSGRQWPDSLSQEGGIPPVSPTWHRGAKFVLRGDGLLAAKGLHSPQTLGGALHQLGQIRRGCAGRPR